MNLTALLSVSVVLSLGLGLTAGGTRTALASGDRRMLCDLETLRKGGNTETVTGKDTVLGKECTERRIKS